MIGGGKEGALLFDTLSEIQQALHVKIRAQKRERNIGILHRSLDCSVIAKKPPSRVHVCMQLRKLHAVSNAAVSCHLYKRDLLLLGTLGRVGQQKCTLDARARSSHRIGIIKIAFDELNIRKPTGLRSLQFAGHGAYLFPLSGQSFDDFPAHSPRRSSNQDHRLK